MAMKAHGSPAMTTIIIIRFRSMASRTWLEPRATDDGV